MWFKKPDQQTQASQQQHGGLVVSDSFAKDENLDSDFILSVVDDGVVMIDGQGVVQLFNPAAAHITGWPATEAVSLDFQAVLPLIDAKGTKLPPAAHALSQSLRTGKTVRDSDATLMLKNGKSLPISIVASPVIGANGAVRGVVAIFRDMAKEREEEARRSDFISTASHEMRTPIAAIEGYLSLALNPKIAQLDDNARQYLQKASAATQHLGVLFQDLLTSSKAEDGRLVSYPKVVEFGEIVQQSVEEGRFRAKEKGLEVSFVLSSSQGITGGKEIRPLYYTFVDPDRIREVLQNLIDNAIKYTTSGSVTVRLTGDPSIIQVQVQDTGMGIPAEDIPHLFQKFYRVDNSATRTIGGTGLGLYICQKIIELYNGRIWVESELGKGSTFFINLPRLSSQEALQMQQSQASTVSPVAPKG